MRKHELGEFLLISLAIIALITIVATAIIKANAAEERTSTLPEIESPSADELTLLSAEAPAVKRDGLNTYQTFEDALEEAKALVPDELAELAGRAVWGEAGGIQDYAQRAAVVWCACNRADAWGMNIGDVLIVSQFHGLAMRGDVPAEHIELARDVLARWTLEAEGWVDVGRVLPSRFLYFEGNGTINLFSTQYGGGEYWR